MKNINVPEIVKKYFWSGFSAVGMICFWAGVWEGIGELPILDNPFVSLAVGVAILFASGTVFKEFNPLEDAEHEIHKIINQVNFSSKKHEFHLKYHDKVKRKNIILKAGALKRLEKGFMVLVDKTGREIFVPLHRVTEILHKDKAYWKK